MSSQAAPQQIGDEAPLLAASPSTADDAAALDQEVEDPAAFLPDLQSSLRWECWVLKNYDVFKGRFP
jgi:hypothetical protein